MIGLYITLVILFLAVLLLLVILYMPIKLVIGYKETVSIKVKILFLSYYIYPKEEKRKKGQKKKKKVSSQTPEEEGAEENRKRSFFEMLSFYRGMFENVVLPAIDDLGKHLLITIEKLSIQVATDDAAKTAIYYGAACNSLNGLFALLSQYCTLKMGKRKNIGVFCRYDLLCSEVSGEVSLRLRVIQAVQILIPALMSYIAVRENMQSADCVKNNQIKSKGKVSHV